MRGGSLFGGGPALGARGFTLPELIVIMVLLGIVSWLAFPKMTAMDSIKLDAAGRRLVNDLRYTQSLAISKRVIHGVLFNAAQQKYTVFATTVSTPIADPADRARTLVVDYTTRTEFKGVQIQSATFGTTPGVTFDYFGVPRDTAGVDLTSTGRVILTYQGQYDTVFVAPQTGVVTTR